MKKEIDQLEAALAEIALTRARLIDIEGHVTEALLSLRVRAQIDADEQRAAEIFQKRQERMQRLALGLFGSLAESAQNYIRDHRPFDDGDTGIVAWSAHGWQKTQVLVVPTKTCRPKTGRCTPRE
jgi:hypothetical protein